MVSPRLGGLARVITWLLALASRKYIAVTGPRPRSSSTTRVLAPVFEGGCVPDCEIDMASQNSSTQQPVEAMAVAEISATGFTRRCGGLLRRALMWLDAMFVSGGISASRLPTWMIRHAE